MSILNGMISFRHSDTPFKINKHYMLWLNKMVRHKVCTYLHTFFQWGLKGGIYDDKPALDAHIIDS